MEVEVRPLALGSKEHRAEIELRTRVLRDPLGPRFSPKDFAEEAEDIRLGAFLDGRLVGCLLLRAVSSSILKMRQVAVDSNFRAYGIGKRLVEVSEKTARDLGAREIVLHARESAVPFYLKLNYEIFDEPFLEVGIPHRKMRKAI